MKRVILKAPAGFRAEDLTEEQAQAIQSVFGQYVQPMPGTIAAQGFECIDAVAGENFDPAAIQTLGLPFEVLGLWSTESGEIIPISQEFLSFLPDRVEYNVEYNEEGTEVVREVSRSSAVLHEPHRWGGWPELF